MNLVHYFDYKSPYAYLAQAATRALTEETGAVIDYLPYTLDIPSYLGSAEVDGQGRVIAENRTPHQWRRARYAYMDCRREARRQNLVLHSPRRIVDSSLAHIGFLWARRNGDPRSYHDEVFRLFWCRELDLEDVGALCGVLERCGIGTGGFAGFLAGEGRAEHERIRSEAEARGVYGVPSYLVDGELFFGNERIERVRERILSVRY